MYNPGNSVLNSLFPLYLLLLLIFFLALHSMQLLDKKEIAEVNKQTKYLCSLSGHL